MLAKVLADYGGAKINATPVSNPTTQVDADHLNRQNEDTAQLTRVTWRATVSFPTVAAAAPQTVPASSVQVRTVWGSGAAQKPVVTKTGTGLYTITYATSYTDALSVSESVALFEPVAQVRSSDPLDRMHAKVLTVSGNVITVGVYALWVLADVGDNSGLPFQIIVRSD